MPIPRRPADAQPNLPTAELRASLLAWYDRARRALPWRALPGERSDPWRVLVSELMLQQTTVATVRGRFEPFMARFPDLPSLAAAPLDDVLHAWQGLGYYRRARSLHACARTVVERHGGVLPLRYDELRALPGIGPYTAAAVAAIAGGEAIVAVDANVERVLSRLLAIDIPLPGSRPQLRAAAERFAGTERPADFAQALMELGALVCSPRHPGCVACPWQRSCRAAARGDPELFPRKQARSARAARFATAFLLERADGAVLFRRRSPEGLLGGMIELPATPWLECPVEAAAVQSAAPQPTAWVPIPGAVRHIFTHIELTVQLWRGRAASASDGLWMPPARFDELALPTLTKKLLRHAGLRW